VTMIPRILFVFLLVLGPAILWGTSGTLPDRVATHFGPGGLANGWMSRDGYRTFMLALGTLVPIFVVLVSGFVPRAAAQKSKIPNPDYWLAPERRAETYARMLSHACWLGCAMLVFFTGTHLLLLDANAAQPPRLPERPFIALVVGFVVVLVVWMFALRMRFRRPT
jgi:uncharacterized membrane protein